MKLKKLLLSLACFVAFSATYAQDQDDTSLVNVYFFKSKFFLTQKAKDSLITFIGQHKSDKLLYIVGRCDKWGGNEYNDWLSVQRAKTVAAFLTSNGLPAVATEQVKGYGKRQQVALNASPRMIDSLNRVVSVTASYATVKKIVDTKPVVAKVEEVKKEQPKVAVMEVKKPKPIDTVYLADSVIVPPPYSADILALNKNPRKGDILKIERTVEVRNDTPFVMKKLYVAAETMQEPAQDIAVSKPSPVAATPIPQEIAEDTKSTDLSQDVTDKLKNSKVGESLVLRGINFDNGYHIILKKGIGPLEAVVNAMNKIPTLKIEIQGHVCCWPIGEEGFDRQTKEYNLSYNRAQVVYQYLVDHGIDKSRLSFNGYGMKKPLVYPEKNKNDQYKNRRVEFKIVSK